MFPIAAAEAYDAATTEVSEWLFAGADDEECERDSNTDAVASFFFSFLLLQNGEEEMLEAEYEECEELEENGEVVEASAIEEEEEEEEEEERGRQVGEKLY
ncbi:uncharacterized protein MONOS_680 [Monocercomonoides exilis]|uniref:uncharacterized protein n=1 Tax=Monocercomonoides exilis TaxID=2049356 RepID=UPI0035596B58|nr:hypothetical protein MONOS_680 [Monocercomonoides exilis]|eukprot:MONOS_680.1-p1 / transcript=MONOS_680.1 / gene=MONOS_680 / organism=Monocercomonoides_exilis_PA203 / gene_product=unspecified product / transcript_product=unspecified product / location=Mono_scaffold00011:148594-148896(-) / protein_length=101 / sequence_SO=supercontig / SO=protein_coding / is_pseudo=false